jgi:very-short-patch-repair endonuclease
MMVAKSNLEETLLLLIRAEGLPEPEREWRFHPTRKWRLDFAYPEKRIGIEVQGGTYIRGAHSRGTGLERDYEKYNQAQVLGWDVYQFSRKMIESGEAIETIKRVLESEE